MNILSKPIEAIIAGCKTSLAAGFATAPVLLNAGMPISVWSPAANLVAVPATALFFLPGSLLCAGLELAAEFPRLFGFPTRWAGESLSWIHPLGRALSHGAQGAEGLFFVGVEGWLSAVEWLADRVPDGTAPFMGSLVVVGTVGLWGLFLLRKAERSLIGVGGLAVCWGLVVWFSGPLPAGGVAADVPRPRTWFFDVGQGDATLIEGREGVVLIDTGNGTPDGRGGRALVRSLKSLGLSEIDLLILTHADLDHRGGAERTLTELAVKELWLPESAIGDPGFARILRLAKEKGTRIVGQDSGHPAEVIGDLRLVVLWPPPSTEPVSGASRNALSLVTRVEAEGSSMLFLADIGKTVEGALLEREEEGLKADLVKVAHHGSRDGSRSDFLDVIGASEAIVSAPCLRRRGLPNLDTLARLRKAGLTVWWTGRDGALVAPFEKTKGVLMVRPWATPRNCHDPMLAGGT